MMPLRSVFTSEADGDLCADLDANLYNLLSTCNVEAIEILLHEGMDPNFCFKSGHNLLTALLLCAESDRWKAVASLLVMRGTSVNARDTRGVPVVCLFIIQGATDMVNMALDFGAHIEARGPSGETPLLTAVHYQQVECLRLLLMRGANPNVTSNDGSSALLWASSRSNGMGYPRSLCCVKLLLQYGANPDFQNSRGYTPLMASSVIGEVEVVKTLLQYGASVDVQDGSGATALCKAAEMNTEGVAEVLLKYGARVNPPSRCSYSPLMITSSQSMMLGLLSRDADPNFASKDHCTALHFRAREGRTDLVQLLVKNGAIIDAKNLYSETPLQLAVRGRKFETSAYLLECGADPNNSNDNGIGVLHDSLIPWNYFNTIDIFRSLNSLSLMREFVHYANCSSDANMLVGELVRHGGSVNCADTNKVTPLMLASASGDIGMCRFLLKSGALVDAEDACGRTPLFYACKWGNKNVVSLLMQHGCDCNHTDSSHNLPIYYAAMNSHTPVVLLLMIDFAFYVTSNFSLSSAQNTA